MTDNAPRTLWVVVDKDGGGDANMHRPTERSAILLAKEWDVKYPEDAPHRVVAYSPAVPQGASVPREPTDRMCVAGSHKWNHHIIEDTPDLHAVAHVWRAMYDAAPHEPVKAEPVASATGACLQCGTVAPFHQPYCPALAAQEDKP